jgi:GT2 family glycosyltransferase
MARWDDLRAAIQSLRDQTVKPDEVVVVVDYNAELEERLRATEPDVTVVANTARRGLSGARNTGIASVTGEVVAFLDDDAAARPDWLERMIVLYDDPRVVAVGGNAVPVWPGRRAPATLPPELLWVVGCSYRGMPERLGPVRNVMGCSMSFRSDVFALVGGFEESVGRLGTLPLGCEETELCIRIQQARPDSMVLLEPRSVVDHNVSADRLTWSYLIRRSYSEGISKAAVGRMVGSRQATSTERTYVSKVLPSGMAREIRSGSMQSAAAMTVSVFAAGVGYAKSTVSAMVSPT